MPEKKERKIDEGVAGVNYVQFGNEDDEEDGPKKKKLSMWPEIWRFPKNGYELKLNYYQNLSRFAIISYKPCFALLKFTFIWCE